MEWTQVFDLYTTLQPVQLKFWKSRAKYRLFGGAKGGWKSHWMRAEAVKQCLSARNIRGLMLRRTSPEIRENMIVPLQMELPPEKTWFYNYNKTDSIFKFHNWSTIRFSYCQNLADVMNYQGIEYDFIGIEELTHWDELEWKMLMWSLRTTRKWIKPNFFASTNPWSRWHGWVKRLWIDRNFKEGENPAEFDFIPARVWDNQILLETQPEYIRSLQMLPEKERRAFLEGDWNVFDGQFFTEFRESLHIVPPFVPRTWIKRRIICLDYWYTNPSAVYWLAQDNQWNVTAYRELYVTGKTYKQLALMIKAMTPADEECEIAIVDPAIINKPSETTWTSWKDEMQAVWLKVKGADNSRVSGWQNFRQYLQPFEDPNTHEITAAFKITSNCVNLIRTLPTLVHDKTNVEDLDTKLEDHAADAIRYWLKELGARRTSLSDIRSMNEAFNKKLQQEVSKTTSFLHKKPTIWKSKGWILTMQF